MFLEQWSIPAVPGSCQSKRSDIFHQDLFGWVIRKFASWDLRREKQSMCLFFISICKINMLVDYVKLAISSWVCSDWFAFSLRWPVDKLHFSAAFIFLYRGFHVVTSVNKRKRQTSHWNLRAASCHTVTWLRQVRARMYDLNWYKYICYSLY